MTEIADALRVDPTRMGTARLASALSEASIAATTDDVIEQADTTMPIVHHNGGEAPKVIVKPAAAVPSQTESSVDEG